MMSFFSDWWKKKETPRYSYKSLVDSPNKIEDNIVYIIGVKHCKWLAMFVCPCGCGDTVQLNLLPDCDDQWRVRTKRKLITISPSINRRFSCRAHFSIIKGQVRWF